MGQTEEGKSRSISLGWLVLLVSSGFLILSVVTVLIFSSMVKERAIQDLARDDARQTSMLVFESLYSAMRKGWNKNEIAEIIGRLNLMLPDVSIRVFRGEPVIALYGDVSGEREVRESDQDVMTALSTGAEKLLSGVNSVRYIFPVIAERECLRCHTNAKVGDVNGVVDIEFPITDLKVSLDFVLDVVIGYFVILIALLFVVLYIKLRYLIVTPVMQLVRVIREIENHSDLSQRVEVPSLVTEVKQLTSHFNGLLATLQDYNHQLEDLSVKDPLTGLLNRRKFEEVVEFELQRSRRQSYQLCLVFIDLDNFKQINDTQGHPVGDLLLREVAKVLSGMLRASDIIARMGGDEFAILMPDTTRVQGLSVAEKLRQSLSATNINLPDGPTRVLGSFGLVASPDNGEEVSALFTAMDVAMYKAKRTGKNRVVSFDADDHEAVRDVYNQSEDIRRSLVEDRIEVYYQPICDLTNGALLGYEALARVRHGKALVDAAQFIHVAEQVGLVEEIDLRVFKKVLEHKRNFPLNGIPIFVNISERTISNGERIRHMMTLTEEAAVVPSEIVFEFAERDALPHLSMLRELTEDLHRVGFGVALDNFGSGFSSFLNLKYLHVTYVKMEGSLVKHVHMDEKNRVMIDHFNQIAIKFNIRALAKLVEDADTARVVAELGISAGQGFHVGAPKDIDATVRDQRERGRTI